MLCSQGLLKLFQIGVSINKIIPAHVSASSRSMTENQTTPMGTAGMPTASAQEDPALSLFTFMRQQQVQLDRLTGVVTEFYQYIKTEPALQVTIAPPATLTVTPAPREPGQAPVQPTTLLERYSRDLSGCRSFILSCELYFSS